VLHCNDFGGAFFVKIHSILYNVHCVNKTRFMYPDFINNKCVSMPARYIKCVTSCNILPLRLISRISCQAGEFTYTMQLLILTSAAYFLEYPNKNNNNIFSPIIKKAIIYIYIYIANNLYNCYGIIIHPLFTSYIKKPNMRNFF
jgi:hypothetical protein